MLSVRVPAIIAALLFMSSASAHAMQFADRPGLNAGMDIVHAISSEDRLRRQIESQSFLRFVVEDFRRMPVSGEGPGRLSAEYSAPVMSLKVATGAAMRFEDRPGPLSNRFKSVAAVAVKGADHLAFRSGLPRSSESSNSTYNEFCIGSMAPCGKVIFAVRVGNRSQSAARLEERL
jgi:hypothetical protein